MKYQWVVFLIFLHAPVIQAQNSFILSRNIDFSTDDRLFFRNDTLYMLLKAPEIDYNNLEKNEFELKTKGGKFEGSFQNHQNGIYTAQIPLVQAREDRTEWEWAAKVQDNHEKYEAKADIRIIPEINLVLEPDTDLNFGRVVVGQSRDQTLTISNAENSQDNLTGDVSETGFTFSIVQGEGRFDLEPGQSREVVVRYRPLFARRNSGTLTINHNATNLNSPHSISMTGLGEAETNISMSLEPDGIFDFDTVEVGQSSDMVLTIRNADDSNGNLTGEISESGEAFELINGDEKFELSPGQSFDIPVRYFPQTEGEDEGALTLRHNATNVASPKNIALTGIGQVKPNIKISLEPDSLLNFGELEIGESLDMDLTITNADDSNKNFTGEISEQGEFFTLVGDNRSFDLPPGQSVSMTVRYSPQTEGTHEGALILNHNATNVASPNTIALMGSAAPLTISAPEAILPDNRSFVEADRNTVIFIWNIPETTNSRPLHFKIEIDDQPEFNTPLVIAESQTDSTHFSPAPPAASGRMSYTWRNLPGDGVYWWRVSANYGDIASQPSQPRNLVIDKTPPVITVLRVVEAHFSPHWFNQNRAESAVIEIQYSESYTETISIDSGVLQSTVPAGVPSGRDQRISIDVQIGNADDGIYPIKVAISDSAGNAVFDSTSIALDATPPEGTEASSPQTSREEQFTVTWINQNDDGSGSGLSGKFDIRFQEDGGVWQDWLSDYEETSAQFTGENGKSYGFEVAAYDNVGNRELFTEQVESETVIDLDFNDTIPPTIEHTHTPTVEEGERITITARIEDNIGVKGALLFFKQGGKSQYIARIMMPQGNDLFAAAIEPNEIGKRGINYFIRAADAAHFVYLPPENWATQPLNLASHVKGTDGQGMVNPTQLKGGDTQNDFRMISIPLLLEQSDASSVLMDDLGDYNIDIWRLFEFDPAVNQFREYPDIVPFSPGRAFWLIANGEARTIDSGVGTTVPTNEPFRITLSRGWNDIGNPFPFAIDWENVTAVENPNAIMGPYAYSGEWLLPDQVEALEPWQGYAVYSAQDGITMSFNPIESNRVTPLLKTSAEGSADWFIHIEANCGDASDRFNYAGAAADAHEQWDARDYLEPPPIGNFISLSFTHYDWQIFQGDFTSDFRPLGQEVYKWEFQVNCNIPQTPATLRFNNLESLPENYEVRLLHPSAFEEIKLQPGTFYSFRPSANSEKQKFILLVGPADKINESELFVPEKFSLSQNFPNPFNARTNLRYHVPEAVEVSIRVFNLLGQQIKTLYSGRQEPGSYQIHWDGTNTSGTSVSSGIYMIRFEAGHYQHLRKVVLLK